MKIGGTYEYTFPDGFVWRFTVEEKQMKEGRHNGIWVVRSPEGKIGTFEEHSCVQLDAVEVAQ